MLVETPATQQTTQATSPKKFNKGKIAYVVVLVLVGVLAGTLGYFLAQPKGVMDIQAPEDLTFRQKGQLIGPASIIKSQQALAAGTILKLDNTAITVRGDGNDLVVFKLSSLYQITTTDASPSARISYNDPTKIQINKYALINLELQGEEYMVTGINYIPAPGTAAVSTPAPATSAATATPTRSASPSATTTGQ